MALNLTLSRVISELVSFQLTLEQINAQFDQFGAFLRWCFLFREGQKINTLQT